ncbi:hypothetical protein CROQUDRAFT_105732 [Cronartium quercuum f. sp. fusiforme G11]|uniref:Uncharacterized protein n=1 Tax=Cronartium quercuum f. sp. fusiforme G11 TaxID=708437 RepID=A0A9P6NM62_9BASI|nr:hypothetical protein CROQUDRAFT_105732 [Cronartium quercuum f. sp. fusiforme G11]
MSLLAVLASYLRGYFHHCTSYRPSTSMDEPHPLPADLELASRGKSAWDHQLAQHKELVLRLEQLEIEPIDETVADPKPAAVYIQRGLQLLPGGKDEVPNLDRPNTPPAITADAVGANLLAGKQFDIISCLSSRSSSVSAGDADCSPVKGAQSKGMVSCALAQFATGQLPQLINPRHQDAQLASDDERQLSYELDIGFPPNPPAVPSSIHLSSSKQPEVNSQRSAIAQELSHTACALPDSASPTEISPTNCKDDMNSSQKHLNPIVEPTTGLYAYRAWKSQLSSVRAELDALYRPSPPSPKAIIAILGSFVISPTPSNGDWSSVPPAGRLEVLSTIISVADQTFLSGWVKEKMGMKVLEAWFRGALHRSARGYESEALLLAVLQQSLRLCLRDAQWIADHVQPSELFRVRKAHYSTQQRAEREYFFKKLKVKRLSSSLEQQWREIVKADIDQKAAAKAISNVVKRSGSSLEPEVQLKKRKIEPTPSAKQRAEPLEDIVEPAPSTPIASASNIAKVVGSGSSLESAQPQKRKIEPTSSAKQRPEPLKVIAEPTLLNPIVFDPFSFAMAQMKRRTSVDDSGPPSAPPIKEPSALRNKKVGKKVRFAPEDKLRQIKIVERLVYDGEVREAHPLDDVRRMEASEGQYLSQGNQPMKEEMEWVYPLEVKVKEIQELCWSLELPTPESIVQTKREKTAQKVNYQDVSQIPNSPLEPLEESGGSSRAVPGIMRLGDGPLSEPGSAWSISRAHEQCHPAPQLDIQFPGHSKSQQALIENPVLTNRNPSLISSNIHHLPLRPQLFQHCGHQPAQGTMDRI